MDRSGRQRETLIFVVYKYFPFFTCPRKYIVALPSTFSDKTIDPFRGKIGCTFVEASHRRLRSSVVTARGIQKQTYFLFCFLVFNLLVGRT